MYNTAVKYNDFDILGHFDYIARYSSYPKEQRNITLKQYGEYLEPLLQYLAQNGKLLEVNTKSYMDHNGLIQELDINILNRLRALGEEEVSLGSDSYYIIRQRAILTQHKE